MHRLGSFFFVKNFEFQHFGFFSQKYQYFLGYEDFVDIFLGHHNWTISRGNFYAIKGLFLRPRYRMGIFFWVAKISNIFLRCLKSLIFFLGWTVDAGP